MKKILRAFLILIISYLLTSFSGQLLQDKGELTRIHTLTVDENQEILYAIIDEIDNYRPQYTDETDVPIMSLVSKCMDSLIIDYDRLEQLIINNDDKVLVKVTSVDIENLIFVNTLSTNYNNYEKFLNDINANFVNQLDDYLNDTSQYSYYHEIIAYIDRTDKNNIVVTLDEENLQSMSNYFYINLFNRYQTYMNNPDIQGVSFMKTLENISAEDLYKYIDEKNPNVFDDELMDLYISFVQQYINNIEITSVIFTDTDKNPVLPSEATRIQINYNSQDGALAIESSINTLLDKYINEKQVPKDKIGVISDISLHINNYVVDDTKDKQAKTIVLENITMTDRNSIIDKSMMAMSEDLFYNMQSLGSIVDEKWQLINENYFFTEKTIDKTKAMYDAFPDADYRVLEIESDLEFGSYVKIHKYDSESNLTGDAVYSAYILPGESIQTSLPEGDYVFRYATGEKWYGAVYMFADTGQYMSVSNVLKFHEPYLKTTIILGEIDDDNMNAQPMDADGF